MPTKLARTVASSVCGRISHCKSVTITATTAPRTINAPSSRPATRRARESPGPSSGVISLDSEEDHPENEGDQDRDTRIDEHSRADVGIDAHANEELSRDHRGHDADRGAEH